MRRRTAGSLALAAALALGGCSGGDDGSEPEASDGGTTGSTTAGTPSQSSQSPGDDTTPSVKPATGDTLRMPHSMVRVPVDWHADPRIVPTQRDAGDDDTSSTISLGEINAFGATLSPDQLARNWFRSTIYPLKPRKLPTVEVDGVEMYHLSGKIQPLTWLEEYGAVVDDRIVTLTFQFSPEVRPAQRDRIAESVLATFRWR